MTESVPSPKFMVHIRPDATESSSGSGPTGTSASIRPVAGSRRTTVACSTCRSRLGFTVRVRLCGPFEPRSLELSQAGTIAKQQQSARRRQTAPVSTFCPAATRHRTGRQPLSTLELSDGVRRRDDCGSREPKGRAMHPNEALARRGMELIRRATSTRRGHLRLRSCHPLSGQKPAHSLSMRRLRHEPGYRFAYARDARAERGFVASSGGVLRGGSMAPSVVAWDCDQLSGSFLLLANWRPLGTVSRSNV